MRIFFPSVLCPTIKASLLHKDMSSSLFSLSYTKSSSPHLLLCKGWWRMGGVVVVVVVVALRTARCLPESFHAAFVENIQRKGEDRIGCRRSRCTAISTTTTTYLHHYPPTLTKQEVGRGNQLLDRGN